MSQSYSSNTIESNQISSFSSFIPKAYTYNPKLNLELPDYDLVLANNIPKPAAALAIKRRFSSVVEISQFTNDFMATAMIRHGERKIVIASIYLYLSKGKKRHRDHEADMVVVRRLIDEFSSTPLMIMTDSNAVTASNSTARRTEESEPSTSSSRATTYLSTTKRPPGRRSSKSARTSRSAAATLI